MPATTKTPNAEQSRFWNDVGGHTWVDAQESLDECLEPFGHAAMDAAGVAAGEDVLDVGCGCGATSFELGTRVGSDGSVLGLDLSETMLGQARSRSTATNVHFEHGDAQVHPLAVASADLVFSRFGVMFFEEPPAAFANLRGALRPGGRIVFICWQALQKNPWMAVPLSVAARHVEPPPPPPPGTPGPLALADPDHVRAVLEGGGYHEIAVESLERPMSLGATVDEAVSFLLRVGPTARMLRDHDDELRGRVGRDLQEALGPFASDSRIELASSSWVVTARPRG